MDFTLKKYIELLNTLICQGFSLLTLEEFILNPAGKVIVLRHDVDASLANSLKFAIIQSEKGIKGTYYFRILPECFDEKIIKEIYSFGHEIGYHYETVEQCNGDIDKAYLQFCQNLTQLRKIVSVETICMHGSPYSKFDNRLIWEKYDFRILGIKAEPYFDVNFEEVLYLTDTGRRWDGGVVSIRDKAYDVKSATNSENYYTDWTVKPIPGSLMNMTPTSIEFQNKYKFRTSSDLIRAAENGELPDKIMMTFHPQRWTNKPLPWLKELVWQNVKNAGKYFLIKMRNI